MTYIPDNLPSDFTLWNDDDLNSFAEYHKQIGIDIGRSQMIREIADRDIEKMDALPKQEVIVSLEDKSDWFGQMFQPEIDED